MVITIGMALAALAAGISIGMAGLSSSIGVGLAGVAGAGAVAENPKQFRTALVLQSLPQTQAVYGLLGGILIMLSVGMFSSPLNDVSLMTGVAVLGVALAIGITSFSAVSQGAIATAGISASAKQPEAFGKFVVLSAMAETFAIFGLAGGVLILIGLGLL